MYLIIALLLLISTLLTLKKRIRVQLLQRTLNTKMSLKKKLSFEVNFRLTKKFTNSDFKPKNQYLKILRFLIRNLTLIQSQRAKAHYVVESSSTLLLQCIILEVKKGLASIKTLLQKMGKIQEMRAHTCLLVLT